MAGRSLRRLFLPLPPPPRPQRLVRQPLSGCPGRRPWGTRGSARASLRQTRILGQGHWRSPSSVPGSRGRSGSQDPRPIEQANHREVAHPECSLSPRPAAIAEVMKCEHERAVHLFVDSLMNQDKPSFAFQCIDSNRFKKGICLSCRNNRCNSIGYNAKKTRKKRNSKMYLKTRAGMPFRVYHYQMKIHVFSYKNIAEIEPTFYVTLYGTNADSQSLPLEIVEQIRLNATNTFLVYTEEDLGDLLKIKVTWERESQSWYNLWKELRNYLSPTRKSEQELHIRRIRMKSGETQRKFTLCAEDPEHSSISPGQELWFRKCLDGWRMKNETRSNVELP